MSRAVHLALIVAAGAVFVLMLERHSMVPQLAAERARAHQFAAIIANCANGGNFTIDGMLVKCRPVERAQP